IIVGTGSDRIEAETIASSCSAIQLVGELDSSRVAHMMRAADIIVVPSMLYENSPSVVVEALSLGRPVSVSDVGGAAELVRESDGGWVVEPTEDAWRAHILWLFKNQKTVVQRIPLLDLPNATAEFEKLYLL
ncbi:MAG: glycosyltransferase, partial [Candidatus Magasanikbacteria bacterium]|nr:glycosyltransferase [Candidatus Magasanikbacteria bacterium]